MFVMPVMLPPGRARLSTSPAVTGSVTPMNTMGIVVVACFAAERGVRRHRNQYVGLLAHQLGRKLGKPLETAALMTVLNDNVLSLNVAEIAQTLPKCLQTRRVGGR